MKAAARSATAVVLAALDSFRALTVRAAHTSQCSHSPKGVQWKTPPTVSTQAISYTIELQEELEQVYSQVEAQVLQ